MPTRKKSSRAARRRRTAILADLRDAGRSLSDSAVAFHTAVAESLGLTASEWKVLGFLQQGGALTAGEIAERSAFAPATISGILKELERKRWIERTRDPSDNRRVLVSILPSVNLKQLGRIFDQLTAELSQVYSAYNADELELILEAIRRIGSVQTGAAVRLSRPTRGEAPQ
ncbi:MarR family winged helix-turn-helix transcriptional regulator [Lentisalinibacter sediminis]|uniref:MarR family winged helix-turn-helix transcriptional regulator n=1 Tax=Lentisalinibacter sediminis TaxID=2992237 RepID=UPI00386CC758